MAAPVLANDSDAVRKEYNIVHNQDTKCITISHIYKQTLLSRFNFMKGYKIITVEKKHSMRKSKDAYLLSRDEIRSYRRNYQFLHIGLVQFSISCRLPNSRESFPLSVCLRDSQYPNFQDSIFVSIDSDLCVSKGNMNFNWFPNFSSSLSVLVNSNNGLVVTIDPQDDSEYLDINYRVYFKLMKTSLKPDYLFDNPVLEVNTEKVNVIVPKISDQS
ncbi:uncharacterized protein LOC123889909 [Trifolium pratense]|uniref:uncharacterized protein LOC123889909 n=1 Tax=Trifolium pratense TaxID=57577 RepID=UPI001E693D73|nr:uncharacterized protein LOC123889909 [Trifolium pratense]